MRLEQGRAVKPSSTTIDARARARGPNTAAHAHLRALARNVHPQAFVRETVPDSLRRLIDGLNQPAYIAGRRWDILAWNAGAGELFTDFGRLPEEDRNILIYTLLDPAARRVFGTGWAKEAKRMVALFRSTHDLWAGDPAFIALLDRLREGSREFGAWWDKHEIGVVAGGRKLLQHPEKGPLPFEHASFQANDDLALKLVIYTPV